MAQNSDLLIVIKKGLSFSCGINSKRLTRRPSLIFKAIGRFILTNCYFLPYLKYSKVGLFIKNYIWRLSNEKSQKLFFTNFIKQLKS